MTSAARKSRASRAADEMTAPTADAITAALTAAGVSEADISKMIKSTQKPAPKMNVKRAVGDDLVRATADLAA